MQYMHTFTLSLGLHITSLNALNVYMHMHIYMYVLLDHYHRSVQKIDRREIKEANVH